MISKTYCNWNIHMISGHFTIIITCIHMDMVIVVYKCGRGRKCLYKLTYTTAFITQMEMQKEEEDRHMSKAMSTSIGTVT